MAQVGYQKILELAEAELSAEDQQRLVDELSSRLRNAQPRKERTLLELRGLGQEFWRSIDVDKYLEEVRNSGD